MTREPPPGGRTAHDRTALRGERFSKMDKGQKPLPSETDRLDTGCKGRVTRGRSKPLGGWGQDKVATLGGLPVSVVGPVTGTWGLGPVHTSVTLPLALRDGSRRVEPGPEVDPTPRTILMGTGTGTGMGTGKGRIRLEPTRTSGDPSVDRTDRPSSRPRPNDRRVWRGSPVYRDQVQPTHRVLVGTITDRSRHVPRPSGVRSPRQ